MHCDHPQRRLIHATLALLVGGALACMGAQAQSSSLLIEGAERPLDFNEATVDPAEMMHSYSIFTVRPPRPHQYLKHDLIDIIIRETSTVRSTHEKTTEKETEIKAEIADFPQLTVEDLLNGVIRASESALDPKLDISSEREFEGEGEVKRTDDFAARVKARIIEVWPNGNLVVEARTRMRIDGEESTILLSGVCDPLDIVPPGSVLSSQLFDLQVIKLNEGDLRRTTEKGFFTRALEGVFAF